MHSNGTWIGRAVCKKVTIETLDNTDLSGKEVQPITMVELDGGTQEEIPFGTFIMDRLSAEQVKSHTANTGYDYMIKFRIPYEHTLGTNFTALQLFNDICEQAGVTAGSQSFINSSYVIAGNPYTNGETCEDVLKDIAKLAAGFAKIGRDDKCYIQTITYSGEEVEEISGMDYTDEFELYGTYGSINKLHVGLSQVDGEYVERKSPRQH